MFIDIFCKIKTDRRQREKDLVWISSSITQYQPALPNLKNSYEKLTLDRKSTSKERDYKQPLIISYKPVEFLRDIHHRESPAILNMQWTTKIMLDNGCSK